MRTIAGVAAAAQGSIATPFRSKRTSPEVGADWGTLQSPETYVGHQKAENFPRLLAVPR